MAVEIHLSSIEVFCGFIDRLPFYVDINRIEEQVICMFLPGFQRICSHCVWRVCSPTEGLPRLTVRVISRITSFVLWYYGRCISPELLVGCIGNMWNQLWVLEDGWQKLKDDGTWIVATENFAARMADQSRIKFCTGKARFYSLHELCQKKCFPRWSALLWMWGFLQMQVAELIKS